MGHVILLPVVAHRRIALEFVLDGLDVEVHTTSFAALRIQLARLRTEREKIPIRRPRKVTGNSREEVLFLFRSDGQRLDVPELLPVGFQFLLQTKGRVTEILIPPSGRVLALLVSMLLPHEPSGATPASVPLSSAGCRAYRHRCRRCRGPEKALPGWPRCSAGILRRCSYGFCFAALPLLAASAYLPLDSRLVVIIVVGPLAEFFRGYVPEKVSWSGHRSSGCWYLFPSTSTGARMPLLGSPQASVAGDNLRPPVESQSPFSRTIYSAQCSL